MSNNTTLMNTSTNDVFFSFLEKYIGFNIADSFMYYILMIAIFLIIYMILRVTNLRSGVKITVAALPFLLSEAFITNFGTYTIFLPLGNEIVTNRFVHVFQLLDFIFHYGIFQYAGVPIINNYIENVTFTEPTGTMYWLIAALSFGDTLIQIIILSFGFYAITTLIENKFNFQIPCQKLISVILGTIPNLIMAMYYSNPLHEFEKSKSLIAIGIYFFQTVIDQKAFIDLTLVMTFLIISITIIYFVLSIFVDVFVSTYINVNPRAKSIDFNVSISALTLMIVLAYSFVFLFHPEYSWYKILSVLLLISIFKKFLDTVVVTAKNENRQRRNQESLALMLALKMNGKTQKPKSPNNLDTIIPLIFGIIFIGIGCYLFFF